MKLHGKKLYRSADDRMIFGVMGGFGEYFEVDPVLLRVVYAGFSIASGIVPGILAYLLMAIMMPKKEHVIHAKAKIKEEEAPLDK
jgi:phage shock protein C